MKKYAHGGARPGSGRKPSGKIRCCVMLPPKIHQKAKALSEAKGISLGDALALLIEKKQR